MWLSLTVGLLMLIGKATAYFVTHSAAIFSRLDATLRPFQASLDTRKKIGYPSVLKPGSRLWPAGHTMWQCYSPVTLNF
jgi:hypothetical protein